MKGYTVKQWIRVAILGLLMAAGVLAAAGAAQAGDPSQWGSGPSSAGKVSYSDL